ncbi:entericidin [Hellea sp.]|nr:entericidin [Hellea sp.]
MKNSPAKKAALIIVTGLTLLASACNTIEGVGADIESSGGAIEDAAK